MKNLIKKHLALPLIFLITTSLFANNKKATPIIAKIGEKDVGLNI